MSVYLSTALFAEAGNDTLFAEAGSYALAGQIAALLHHDLLPAEPAGYWISGIDIGQSYFDEAVDAILSGRAVRMARLVEFEFASETARVWEGAFTLPTLDSKNWDGVGRFGTMSYPELGPGLPTQQVTYTLSGLDPALVAKLDDQTAEVKGRRNIIYVQAFDEDWQPLGKPYVIRSLVMDVMRRLIDYDGKIGSMELTAEPILATKHFAPNGLFTGRDQEERGYSIAPNDPPDRGMERVALYSGRVTTVW